MSKTEKRPSASRSGLIQTDPRTSSAVRDKFGEQLRVMYGKLEEEPLPDRLLALARRLDELEPDLLSRGVWLFGSDRCQERALCVRAMSFQDTVAYSRP
ncbi:hypothetical protein IC232_29540 [Microvirga sp. BT688]|uniref:NepR family anti-sigma factor n=1 Tax=Microvirga sp. TaxID=1873136 RepID=UPI001687D203|nr:hypothetical protein [Microvirga sp.]